MLSIFTSLSRRRALRQLVNELFRFNRKDDCFDPLGSISRDGMNRAIETIARGNLSKESIRRTEELFNSIKRYKNSDSDFSF